MGDLTAAQRNYLLNPEQDGQEEPEPKPAKATKTTKTTGDGKNKVVKTPRLTIAQMQRMTNENIEKGLIKVKGYGEFTTA